MKNGIKPEIEGTRSVRSLDSPLKTASGELPMTEASQKTQALLAQYERQRGFEERISDREEDATDCRDSNKATVFSLLKAGGVAVVMVDYNGGGDNGQIDNVLAFGAKPESGPTPEMALPEGKVTLRVPSFDNPNAQEQTFSLREAIEELCWMVLGSRHPGWEINDGGEGVFILDVARGTINARRIEDATMTINDDRAEWAQAALETFSEVTGSEMPRNAVADLLPDIGHFCDRNLVDFLEEIERAIAVWLDEKSDPEGISPPNLKWFDVSEKILADFRHRALRHRDADPLGR